MAIPTVPCDPAGPSASDATMAGQLNPQLHNKMAGYLDGYMMSCARFVTQTGPAAWSEWEGSGGIADAELATARSADGRVEVFGTSQAGVYHRWQTGFSTWSEWGWLNGSGPSVG